MFLKLSSTAILWIAKCKPGLGRVKFLINIVEGASVNVEDMLIKIAALSPASDTEVAKSLVLLREEVITYKWADMPAPKHNEQLNHTGLIPYVDRLCVGDIYYTIEETGTSTPDRRPTHVVIKTVMTPQTIRNNSEFMTRGEAQNYCDRIIAVAKQKQTA